MAAKDRAQMFFEEFIVIVFNAQSAKLLRRLKCILATKSFMSSFNAVLCPE